VTVLIAVIVAELIAATMRRAHGGPTAEERMEAAVARAVSREHG
jgi:hypothetical protein